MKKLVQNVFCACRKGMLVAALCAAGSLFAGSDVDIPVNGDFKGAVPGTADAPGWTVQIPGVVVQGKDADDFAYELTASGAENFFASPAYYVASGAKVLKIDGEVKGFGNAMVGFEAFDANGALLPEASVKKSVAVNAYWTKFKLYYMLENPRVASIRLIFSVAPGAKVAFGDIDAEFLLYPKAHEIAAARANSVAQVARGAQAVPVAQVAPTAPAAPAAGAHRGNHRIQGRGFAGTPIIDDRYYTLAEFTSGNYAVTVVHGKDIEFKLAANVARGQLWRVEGYDPAVCLVKMKYEQKGFWPLRYDVAEVEIKGVARGNCEVVLLHSSGARAVVKVEVF